MKDFHEDCDTLRIENIPNPNSEESKNSKEIPSISRAKTNRKQKIFGNILQLEYCKLIFTSWKISNFSLETALYFTLHKQLVLMMAFNSIFSIILTIVNSSGGYFTKSEIINPADIFLIGNMYGKRHNSSDSIDMEELEKYYKITWICDSLYSFSNLVFILIFFLYSRKFIGKFYKDSLKISDFAIEAKGFNMKNIDKEKLKNIFKVHGNIYEIYIWKELKNILSVVKNKRKLDNKIIDICCPLFIKSMIRWKMKRNYYNYLDKIKIYQNSKTLKSPKVDRVFIVFRSTAVREKCLNYYRSKIYSKSDDQEIIISSEKNKIFSVKRANEPSEIIWENLKYTRFYRCSRMTLTIFIVLFLLIFSIIVNYHMKTIKVLIPREINCSKYNKDDKGNSKDGDKRLCYCKRSDSYYFNQYKNECKVYQDYYTIILNCSLLLDLL